MRQPTTTATSGSATTSETTASATTTSATTSVETTTSTSESATTGETTTSATTVSEPVSQTTTTISGAIEGGTDTNTTTTTGSALPEEVTKTVTNRSDIAQDHIAWSVETVVARPGEVAELEIKVEDPNNVKLPVAGAQFHLVTADGFVLEAVTEPYDAYKATPTFNLGTKEIAFDTNTDGKGVVADDYSVIMKVKVKVPEDCKGGEFAVYPNELTAVNFEALDGSVSPAEISVTDRIDIIPGKIIVPTIYADATPTYGFYFSHDDGTRPDGSEGGFSKGQLGDLTIHETYTDAEGNLVDNIIGTADDVNFNGETPNSVYVPKDGADEKGFKVAPFKYEVPVYYDLGNGNKPLCDKDGNPIDIEAYIGVKGDVNFDEAANAVDASQVMAYYSQVSVNTDVNTPDTIALSISDLVNGDATSVYDKFAAFLGDTDAYEYAEDNWHREKADRPINSVDASQIMAYYSLASTKVKNNEMTDNEAWNLASPNRFTKPNN